MRDQIAIFTALPEDGVVYLFGYVGRTTKSSPGTKVVSMLQTVVNRAVDKGFRSVAFYLTVEKAVHKSVPEPQSVDTVTTMLINSPAFTVLVVEFIKHKVEKSSVDKARIEEQPNKLSETVHDKQMKIEEGILTEKVDAARSLNPPKDISDDSKTSPKTYTTASALDELEIRLHHTRSLKRRRR